RVSLLARRAARYPDPNRLVLLALDERRDDLRPQHLPGGRIAKERGDGDQQVVEQRLDFVGRLSQEGEIRLEAAALIELHASRETAQNRRALVAREVVAGSGAHELEDALERRLAALVDSLRIRGSNQRCELGLPAAELGEPRGERLDRQDDIGDLRRDDRARHSLM